MAKSLYPHVRTIISEYRGEVRCPYDGKVYTWSREGTADAIARDRTNAILQAESHGNQILKGLEKSAGRPLTIRETAEGRVIQAPAEAAAVVRMNSGSRSVPAN